MYSMVSVIMQLEVVASELLEKYKVEIELMQSESVAFSETIRKKC